MSSIKRILLVLLFSLPLLASEQRDAEKVLLKYKHAFHMDDWKIVLVLDTLKNIQERFHDTHALASSEWVFAEHTGTLYVMRLSEYTKEVKDSLLGPKAKKKRPFPKKDQKNSIVHELVHVVVEFACLGYPEGAVTMLTEAIDP